ncbi:MAG TPA: redoxin domain-containing protein [Planctomycetes bacterium]|nr:redoxin domain-containing protein [Planctomycetota bacterium]
MQAESKKKENDSKQKSRVKHIQTNRKQLETETLAEMRAESGLPFPLLSDRSSSVASKYGSFCEVKRGGSQYQTHVRCTFIIDPSGKIVAMWDNCRVKGHVERVHKTFLKVIEQE